MNTNTDNIVLTYNIFYQCHYKDYDLNKDLLQMEEFQNFSKQDRYYLEKKIYQDDLLSIFGMENENDFLDDKINPMIHELFLKLEKNESMNTLMKKLGGSDPEMGLMMMFSMDLLYLSHPCFCEFLEKGKISNDKLDLLKKEIENLFSG